MKREPERKCKIGAMKRKEDRVCYKHRERMSEITWQRERKTNGGEREIVK